MKSGNLKMVLFLSIGHKAFGGNRFLISLKSGVKSAIMNGK